MKDFATIEAAVIDLISETLQIPREQVTVESQLTDISADSIQLFGLLLAFEKKYALKVSYEDIVSLHTVGDVVAYVAKVTAV